MKLRARREPSEPRVEIIPMIDVMLFLLVFFMLSSLALTRLEAWPVHLPVTASSGATPGDGAALVLSITADERLFLGEQPIAWPELVTHLEARAAPSLELRVSADERASHGAVVRALDAARAARIERFSMLSTPR